MKITKNQKNNDQTPKKIFFVIFFIVNLVSLFFAIMGIIHFNITRGYKEPWGTRDIYQGNIIMAIPTIVLTSIAVIVTAICFIQYAKNENKDIFANWKSTKIKIFYTIIVLLTIIMFVCAVIVYRDRYAIFWFEHGIWKKFLQP